MKHFIEKLRSEINKELPGEQAQFMMAPSKIRERVNKYNFQRAGVLLLLYPLDKNIFFVLIKRSEDEGPHSGQIGLPGGKYEQKDNNIFNTALRETYEEIGVPPENVDIIGRLSLLHIPVSCYLVTPVVAAMYHTPRFHTEENEVSEIIQLPLSSLQNRELRKVDNITRGGLPDSVPYFSFNNHRVWGATAMILSEFSEILHRPSLVRVCL